MAWIARKITEEEDAFCVNCGKTLKADSNAFVIKIHGSEHVFCSIRCGEDYVREEKWKKDHSCRVAEKAAATEEKKSRTVMAIVAALIVIGLVALIIVAPRVYDSNVQVKEMLFDVEPLSIASTNITTEITVANEGKGEASGVYLDLKLFDGTIENSTTILHNAKTPKADIPADKVHVYTICITLAPGTYRIVLTAFEDNSIALKGEKTIVVASMAHSLASETNFEVKYHK